MEYTMEDSRRQDDANYAQEMAERGNTNSMIAQVMGISESTVRKLLLEEKSDGAA